MKTASNILYWALVVFALMQFVPVDRANKPIDHRINFVDMQQSQPEIREMLKNACYDCHSNETKYPGYAYIAPVSWSVKQHVNKGRRHLNFSEWGNFNKDLKRNMLENSVADIQQNRMPMPGYIVYHPAANLSAAQRKVLADYFSDILKSDKF